MVTSPKVEVYTRLACEQLLPSEFPIFPSVLALKDITTPAKCLSDPGVQKATANLQASAVFNVQTGLCLTVHRRG